jgi:hypothetical protein
VKVGLSQQKQKLPNKNKKVFAQFSYRLGVPKSAFWMAWDELQIAATIEPYADREKLFIFEGVTRYNSGIFSDRQAPQHRISG